MLNKAVQKLIVAISDLASELDRRNSLEYQFAINIVYCHEVPSEVQVVGCSTGCLFHVSDAVAKFFEQYASCGRFCEQSHRDSGSYACMRVYLVGHQRVVGHGSCWFEDEEELPK